MRFTFKPFILLSLFLASCSTLPKSNTVSSPNTDLMSILPQTQNTEIPVFSKTTDPTLSPNAYLKNPNVQAFIQYHSEHSHLNQDELAQFFAQVDYKANIINIMNRPGTSRPWYEFRTNNAGGTRINNGKQFYQQHQTIIDKIAQNYGVPSQIIVAILGIETNYGHTKGTIRVADALATLGFHYPRRAALFQKELAAFLQLAQEEKRDPFSYQGSFAGAMGMPQFMPSSFLKWAADGDGDGRRDIWNNTADAAASIANYMHIHGWKKNAKMMIPTQLTLTPELQAIIDGKTELNHTVASLKQLGVQPLENIDNHEKAFLFQLETAPNQYEYFIGLNNFYVVWQYNHSRHYVSAVREIANGITGQNDL